MTPAERDCERLMREALADERPWVPVSPWVERARNHTLAHKVYASAQTDTRVVRESMGDVLRRTMPRGAER